MCKPPIRGRSSVGVVAVGLDASLFLRFTPAVWSIPFDLPSARHFRRFPGCRFCLFVFSLNSCVFLCLFFKVKKMLAQGKWQINFVDSSFHLHFICVSPWGKFRCFHAVCHDDHQDFIKRKLYSFWWMGRRHNKRFCEWKQGHER